MQRKEFLKNAAVLTLGLSFSSLGFANVKKWYDGHGPLKPGDLAEVSSKMDAAMEQLLDKLRENKWTGYLHDVLGVNLDLRGAALRTELIKELDKDKLAALRENKHSGFDDFSGERLVQPGFPAYSLLFHTLASPRVRPREIKEYPSLHETDLLENYIYALCDWGQLKSIYRNGAKEDGRAEDEFVLAVFAYEYRTAFKTPHHAYADMVYSRTGIGRVGDEPMHYDRINRCYINRPEAASDKKVAVMPARYGLYIARKVKGDKISLVKEDLHKGDDSMDDRNDAHGFFLQPVRKVFNDDLLVGGGRIRFHEFHKSEKLEKLGNTKGIIMWQGRKPKQRLSADLVEQDEKLRNAGSSFLVISQRNYLIRRAREEGQPLFFYVNKGLKPGDPDYPGYDNRYFTAFCTQKVEDVELLQGFEDVVRGPNSYLSPRNQPLFVNITNQQANNDTAYTVIPKTEDRSFEHRVSDGGYYAPLFEDSICDGRVDADVSSLNLEKISGMQPECLPAFSIITAPDFFPQVDPLDLEAYDVAPGPGKESNFYEGGVASLATARIKPNPKVLDTANDDTRDTYLAVLSGFVKGDTGVSPHNLPVYKNPASDRGYEISGFLPDVASSVFAPGWDVTYCSNPNDIHDIFVGTEGLGSPFIEDMKFCSALNGMWPATSPDAARTYQGSGEAKFRNPTSVPLLDSEIGICAAGPAGKAHECTGWDGEQGPYLKFDKEHKKWMVNFTDMGRADAVTNAVTGMLDMSKLRKLKAAELIARMECLKMCIKALPQKNFNDKVYKPKITGYTYLWLVSAEKVNWGVEDAAALGIPMHLVGNNKDWITNKAHAKVHGEGYLYLFVNSAPDEENENDPHKEQLKWDNDMKRRNLDCHEIYVCQVTAQGQIACMQVNGQGTINWR